VVAQTREVHDGLPRRYFRGLPVLSAGPLAGLPRFYAIAWTYVAHADSAFEPRLMVELLQAYQQHQPLTQGELWALPTTLRVLLVENLRRLAERVAAEEAARETAHGLCDALPERRTKSPPPRWPTGPVCPPAAARHAARVCAAGDGAFMPIRRPAPRKARASAKPSAPRWPMHCRNPRPRRPVSKPNKPPTTSAWATPSARFSC
jgi:hypothetical protein